MDNPSFLSAFLAGILTFLSPCILPLIPGYLSFISGASLEELQNSDSSSAKIKAILGAIFFGLGFTIIFVLLGASATSLGKLLSEYQFILARIAGVLIIIFGLHMIGVFRINFLLKQSKINYKRGKAPFFIEAFILGMTFVIGWTPCVGPILTGILALAAIENSVYHGMALLFTYSLGLWIPFLLSAVAIGSVMKSVKKAGKYLIWVERVAGALLILIGIILLSGNMTAVTSFFLKLFPNMPVY